MNRLFVILGFVFLIACNDSKYSTFTKDNVSIKIPVYMTAIQNLPEDLFAEFEMKDINDKSDLKVSVYRDKKMNVDKTYSLNDYFKFVADNILDKTLVSGRLNSPKKTIINNYNAMIFEISGKYNYLDNLYDMFFKTAVIETDKYFYEITISTSKDFKDIYNDDMNEIIKSFEISE